MNTIICSKGKTFSGDICKNPEKRSNKSKLSSIVQKAVVCKEKNISDEHKKKSSKKRVSQVQTTNILMTPEFAKLFNVNPYLRDLEKGFSPEEARAKQREEKEVQFAQNDEGYCTIDELKKDILAKRSR